MTAWKKGPRTSNEPGATHAAYDATYSAKGLGQHPTADSRWHPTDQSATWTQKEEEGGGQRLSGCILSPAPQIGQRRQTLDGEPAYRR